MAIPTWTWSDRARERSRTARRSTETAGERDPSADLSATADEFDLLASPLRLEILLTLADSETPLRYTDLRAATSIEDNGKLNYHLRRLEPYVSGGDGEKSDAGDDGIDGGDADSDGPGYDLTPRGRRLLDQFSLS